MVLVRRTRPLCLRWAWVFRKHVWELCHFPSLQIRLPQSIEMKRVSSLCATEPVPARGHTTHQGQWSSERCLPCRWNTRPGFSEGSIQWLPVWEALVLCLIVLLARKIKQPILLIGDLILYVTFLNFWLVLGFLMQEVECFFLRRRAYVLGQRQSGILCGGLLHQ